MLTQKHDARGHKMPGILIAKIYYRNDPESLAILSKYPSKHIVIVPQVTITFDLANQSAARIAIVYPKEHITTEVILSTEQIEWIRDTYHNPFDGWKPDRWENKIYLTRSGRLVHVNNAPSPIVPLVGEGY